MPSFSPTFAYFIASARHTNLSLRLQVRHYTVRVKHCDPPMNRLFLTTTLLLLAAATSVAESPEPLDLDEALARQSVSDLISSAATAYDCKLAERSFRTLGTDEKPIYMIEVSAEGPECEAAMALLARHGSTRDFVFRQWQALPDVEKLDPIEQPESVIEEINQPQ